MTAIGAILLLIGVMALLGGIVQKMRAGSAGLSKKALIGGAVAFCAKIPYVSNVIKLGLKRSNGWIVGGWSSLCGIPYSNILISVIT